MIDPNLAHDAMIGPKNNETKKNETRMAAFHAIGSMAITEILINGLGYSFPCLSGNDLTNIYAITNKIATHIGHIISNHGPPCRSRNIAR